MSTRRRRPTRTGRFRRPRRPTWSRPRPRSRPRRICATTWWKVADQGLDRVLRRLGDRRLRAALAFRQGRAHHHKRRCSRRASSGWPPRRRTRSLSRPTTFIETEGTSLKSALDIARKFGVVRDSSAALLVPGCTAASRTRSTRSQPQLKIRVLQPGHEPDRLAAWLADEGPDPDAAGVDSTWDGVGERRQPRRLPARDGARRPRGRAGRLHGRGGSSCATAGARLGTERFRLCLARLRAGGVHRGVRRRESMRFDRRFA